jgi:hypothetical protein
MYLFTKHGLTTTEDTQELFDYFVASNPVLVENYQSFGESQEASDSRKAAAFDRLLIEMATFVEQTAEKLGSFRT